ncbi:hypothetical protein L3Y19_gp097 [Gordonia phage Neville]|uniref:Uncharacterized protein n=1 Tax=Gordonia phage Neville TaxID=2301693 RepID=A0A385DYF8_9CAUD|nr:hypothetical protein L3Y19_gp097 [Gordonia phage Neville]AXQ64486.1 hypothetical protein SEA_NEVILLE_133 [Gordonia phage Neville]
MTEHDNGQPFETWTVGNVERCTVVPWAELDVDGRDEFDYVDADETWTPRFARYRDGWLDLTEFMFMVDWGTDTANPFALRMDGDHPLRPWGHFQSTSHGTGFVFHDWDDDTNTVEVGYAHTTHTGESFNVFAHVLNTTGEFVAARLCQSCLFGVVNGDWPTVEDDDEPDWTQEREDSANRNMARFNITMGHVHDGPWADRNCFHRGEPCGDDCDCEETTFSDSECGVCETRLAGDRHDAIMIDRATFAKYGRAMS